LLVINKKDGTRHWLCLLKNQYDSFTAAESDSTTQYTPGTVPEGVRHADTLFGVHLFNQPSDTLITELTDVDTKKIIAQLV
jgi:hypothetical protein